MIIQPMNAPLPAFQGIAPVPQLGVIRATGEDAAKFLHGQLTQDFLLMQAEEARLAAFCTAKGRMQASFIALQAGPQDFLLLCSRDLLAPTLKRLSMFVLRAKVRLTDGSDAFQIHGVAGAALQAWGLLDAAPWRAHVADGAHLVTLYPADGVPRALWVAPADAALPAGIAPMSAQDWRLSEVRSGVATLSAAVSEAFVPQMLNYESVDGVNFKKGCYPGQEVVARSQFRGTLKRRALLASSDAAMQAGQELYAAADPEQPCATVAEAAATPQGGSEAIVSGQIAAMADGDLHLGAADGPLVRLRPVPYALREDI
jgi:folate-binding protein YgfZ